MRYSSSVPVDLAFGGGSLATEITFMCSSNRMLALLREVSGGLLVGIDLGKCKSYQYALATTCQYYVNLLMRVSCLEMPMDMIAVLLVYWGNWGIFADLPMN